MKNDYKLASAILRRGRVDLKTLETVEQRVRTGQALTDILFTPEILDMAPDIFPPHIVGGFIDKNFSQGFRAGDTPQKYFHKMTRGRKHSTLRMVSRQLHSAAKADATRRTTSVHPVHFNGVSSISYANLEERYFTFAELHAEVILEQIRETPAGERIHQAIANYRNSTGEDVLTTFFEMMERCKEVGLSQKKEVKHKYPIHGLLYGSLVSMPDSLRQRMEEVGQVVLGEMIERLPTPEEALCFSLDFFLGPNDSMYVGRDVHDQQIGMGLQSVLGVDESASFYQACIRAIAERAPGGVVSLSYDPIQCQKNKLYQMELAALRHNLENAGMTVLDNKAEHEKSGVYALRLFGGKVGTPTPNVTRLTDDKLFIDDILEQHREEFAAQGVIVPATYRCTAADLVNSPQEVSQQVSKVSRKVSGDVIGTNKDERIFVHPTVHHGFKPFELDLSSPLSKTIVQETFTRAGGVSLDRIPIVIMERVPNSIEFAGKEYAHEVRTYFTPGG